MTSKELTFDTAANNTQIATGGSYGGSVVDLYSETSGGDMFVSNAQSMHGGQSVRLTSTGATSVALTRETGYAGKRMGVRFYFRLDAYPTAETIISHIRHGTGVLANCAIATDGQVKFTATNFLFATATPMSVGTWYRFEKWIEVGTTSSNGKYKCGVYSGDTMTLLGGTSGSATNVDFGSLADVASFQFGKVIGAGAAINGYFDTARGDDTALDLLGPWVAPPANVAPTVNAGADQTNVEPWATVTLTGTDSDSDGTIASRAWTQTGGSPTVTLSGTGASRTFEAPGTIAGTTLTFQYAATDDDGASTTDTMTVTVLPVTERAAEGGVEVPMRVRAT